MQEKNNWRELGVNSNLIIIDVNGINNYYHIININRSFNPQGGHSARQIFIYQLDLIKIAFTPNTLVLGDLNIFDLFDRKETLFHHKKIYIIEIRSRVNLNAPVRK